MGDDHGCINGRAIGETVGLLVGMMNLFESVCLETICLNYVVIGK